MSQVSRRETGSIPEDGSSRRISCALPKRAIEVCSLRFWPPEIPETILVRTTVRLKSLRIFSIVEEISSMFLNLQKKVRFSSTVSFSSKQFF